MREIHLRWTAETVANSEYAPIAKIAHSLEVVGHLDIGEDGIRQLIYANFCEGCGPEDLGSVPFLKVESALGLGDGGHLVGLSRAERQFKSVVFPEPDGPRRMTHSPSEISKETPSRARTTPAGVS